MDRGGFRPIWGLTPMAGVATPATSTWQLRDSERIIIGNAALLGRKHLLVAITRLRNEALILPDTLDYLAKHVDAIVDGAGITLPPAA